MVYKLFEYNGEPSSKTKYNVQAIVQMYHEEKIKNSNFIFIIIENKTCKNYVWIIITLNVNYLNIKIKKQICNLY